MFMRAYMTCTWTGVCVRVCADDDEAAKKSVKAKSETGMKAPCSFAVAVAVSAAAAAVGLLRIRRVGAAVCVGF